MIECVGGKERRRSVVNEGTLKEKEKYGHTHTKKPLIVR
jgi:hypothetical protein